MDLKKMFNQLQTKMDEMKQKKEDARYTGESGAGVVKVTIDGHIAIKDVYIDESLKSEDINIIVDLIIAAFTNAKKMVDENDQSSESDLMKLFPLPFNKPPF